MRESGVMPTGGMVGLLVLFLGWSWVGMAAGGEPPAPPILPSPVTVFREWLELSPERREEAMRGRTEAQRQVIRAKLAEYAALPEEEREARLRATEFQYYLRTLLAQGAESRSGRLASVPVEYRAAIESRLVEWEALPEAVRREVLENESLVHSFLRLSRGTPAQREAFLRGMSPEVRVRLEGEMRRWQEMTPEKRRELTRRFQQFFELPPREQDRALGVLSEEERREMEVALERFRKLPPAQRVACVESFGRFAQLPADERVEFLRSAERWREMSAAEREQWRMLVGRFPPLPPGLGGPPMPPRRVAPVVPAGGASGLTNVGR